MSKYSSIDTCFDDQDALVEALKADGFQPLMATDQVAGDPLTGYQGDKRKDRAHVIIPRQQIGSASNDIGFRRGTDGTFSAVISEFDKGCGRDDKWLGKIRQRFVEAKQMAEWKRQGYTEFERTETAAGVSVKAKIPAQHMAAQQPQQSVGFRRT
jgi:hypothetical protein